MFLKLRILFTVLSALFITAVLPLGAFCGLIWAIASAAVAGIFFLLMLIFKQEQEKREPPAETEPESSAFSTPSDSEEKEV